MKQKSWLSFIGILGICGLFIIITSCGSSADPPTPQQESPPESQSIITPPTPQQEFPSESLSSITPPTPEPEVAAALPEPIAQPEPMVDPPPVSPPSVAFTTVRGTEVEPTPPASERPREQDKGVPLSVYQAQMQAEYNLYDMKEILWARNLHGAIRDIMNNLEAPTKVMVDRLKMAIELQLFPNIDSLIFNLKAIIPANPTLYQVHEEHIRQMQNLVGALRSFVSQVSETNIVSFIIQGLIPNNVLQAYDQAYQSFISTSKRIFSQSGLTFTPPPAIRFYYTK